MLINSAGDLRDFVLRLTKKAGQNDITLARYLSSMLAAIENYKDEKPTFEVFSRLIEDSFFIEPKLFDISWFDCTEAPFTDFEPHPDDFDNLLINPETGKVVSKFEVLEKTLQFQIAELKRIENDEFEMVEGENGMYYVTFTDNEWHNIKLTDYLVSMVNNLFDLDDTECDWLTFIDMIEYGRCGY